MLRATIVGLMCVGLGLGGCGDDTSGSGGGGEGGGGTGGGGTGGGGTGGAAQLEEGPGEFDPAFDASPNFFTAMSGAKPGVSPHGTQQTWYSSNIEPVIDADSFEAPVGTVSIKRFDVEGDGTPDGLAVMIKREAGFDAENGDWYYDMRMLDGTIMNDPESGMPIAGAIPMCIDCHQGAAATDYLAGTKVR